MSWRSSKVIDAKIIMAKYQGKHAMMSPDEEAEFAAAHQQLKTAQKMCSHSWETLLTFTSVIEQCRWCDMLRSEYDNANGWNK